MFHEYHMQRAESWARSNIFIKKARGVVISMQSFISSLSVYFPVYVILRVELFFFTILYGI